MPAAVAQTIRNAAKTVDFDDLLTWKVGLYDSSAGFSSVPDPVNPLQFTFTNTSTQATTYLWNFGDGNTSVQQNPVHTYATAGTYNVTLTASKCGTTDVDTEVRSVNVGNRGISEVSQNKIEVFPNPTSGIIKIKRTNTSVHNYEVFDLAGRLVAANTVNRNEINVSQLQNATYLLVLRNSENEVIYKSKFIKK